MYGVFPHGVFRQNFTATKTKTLQNNFANKCEKINIKMFTYNKVKYP